MSHHSKSHDESESSDVYLQYIADLNISPKEKLELICIVGAILSHFVDHAYGVQTDQITLLSIGRSAFNGPLDPAKIANPETQTADAPPAGVDSDSNQRGPSQP